MANLYIIRGVSGSGKSTFAQELAQALYCDYYEADQFFYNIDGEYKFDPDKLGMAHHWCYNQVLDNMEHRAHAIIVSNTFTKTSDMKPYLDLAAKYDYNVVSLVVENRHGNSSIHDVPEHTLARQENTLRQNLKFR